MPDTRIPEHARLIEGRLVDRSALKAVRARLEADDADAALARLDRLGPAGRHDPRALLLRARALLMADRCAGARAALDRAASRGAPERAVMQLRQRLLKREGDREGVLETLTRLARRRPRDATQQVKIARFHMLWRDAEAAEAAARRAVAINPRLPAAHRTLFEALHLGGADPVRIAGAVRRAAEASKAHPGFPGLADLVDALPRDEAAALETALAARWRDPLAPRGADGRRRPDNLWRHALAGRKVRARRLLDRREAAADGPSGTGRARDRALLEALPPPSARRRPLIEDRGTEVCRSAPGRTGTTLLAFTGLGHRLFRDIAVVDAFCARAGAGAIYLRDPSNASFADGLRSLGGGRAETLAALRGLLDEMGTRRLVVLGTSGGTFSAVGYGLALGAHRVLALSPVTTIAAADLAAMGDPRVPVLTRRLQAEWPAADLDLAPQVAAAPPPGGLELHFAAGHPLDAAHAARLAGLPGVTRHPVPGEDHDTMTPLLLSGGLEAALAD